MAPQFELREVEKASAASETLIPSLIHNGDVIIRQLISQILREVTEEIVAYFGNYLGEACKIFAKQSQVVSSIAAKSPSCVESIFCKPFPKQTRQAS